MSIAVHFFTVDPSIGRIDKHSLSTEMLMELLVETIKNSKVLTHDGLEVDRLELDKWLGVTVENEEVTSIHWSSASIEGSINLEWVPDSSTRFNVYGNLLEGIVDLAKISKGSCLERLVLGCNKFSGPLHLRYLPPKLEYLDVANNQFDGSMDLEHLPTTLRQIYGYKNSFSGSLRLQNLPKTLEIISISENNFEGPICLTDLPQSLTGLYLSQCKLSGSLNLNPIPKKLERINLDYNAFSGEVAIDNLRPSGVFVFLDGNSDLNGELRLNRTLLHKITTEGTKIQRVFVDEP
mmetsp:Transcript_5736/g.8668  ORF Transcript_5736/g.8668 Transcript_5736/m.8668 type:complete len:293 (-) Transcript_5736:64-942(-)